MWVMRWLDTLRISSESDKLINSSVILISIETPHSIKYLTFIVNERNAKTPKFIYLFFFDCCWFFKMLLFVPTYGQTIKLFAVAFVPATKDYGQLFWKNSSPSSFSSFESSPVNEKPRDCSLRVSVFSSTAILDNWTSKSKHYSPKIRSPFVQSSKRIDGFSLKFFEIREIDKIVAEYSSPGKFGEFRDFLKYPKRSADWNFSKFFMRSLM